MRTEIGHFSYQTRPKIAEVQNSALSDFASLMERSERTLFADYSKGKSTSELKNSYLKRFQITARQFNSIRVGLEGKIASIKERRKTIIEESKLRVESLEKKIASLEKRDANPSVIHQKKRSLFQKKNRLERLKEDDKNDTVRHCFGSRKLFRAQFALEENGYQSHAEWLKDWKEARNSSFFLLGSKDEAGGNQSCTAQIAEDGSITLRLRLPDALFNQYGKYLIIPNIRFDYGHSVICANLNTLAQRKTLGKDYGVALSYRFLKDKKGWRIFVSTTLAEPKTVTREEIGVIGIDINANHLAAVETDRFGNPVARKIFPLSSYGKSKGQFQALTGDTVAQIVKWSIETKKPIVIEKLNFQKKKTELKEYSSEKHARMLSSFAYQTVINAIKSRAYRHGVKVKEVNPAYTSLIGAIKFAKRYGLTVHESAALCIARRFQNLSEKLPRHQGSFPDGKGIHVAFPLPARNRGQHVWKSWAQVRRKVKVAHAAHLRATKNRSSSRSPPAY